MLDEKQWLSELHKGLMPLQERSFPKKCPKCGRVYVSLLDMICQTANPMRSSGLAVARDKEDKPMLGLFRKCTCGTTLFAGCQDRRDMSEEGVHRRETFAELLKKLEAAGINAVVARQEVLKTLRGEESDLLPQFGKSALESESDTPPKDE